MKMFIIPFVIGGKQLYVFAYSQEVALNDPTMWTQTASHGWS